MKDSDYNNIDKVFNQELKNYSQPVPEDVWEGIESHLNNRLKIKQNRIYKYAAAIAAITLIGSVYLFSVKNSDLDTKILVDETEISHKQKVVEIDQKAKVEIIAKTEKVETHINPKEEDILIQENAGHKLTESSAENNIKVEIPNYTENVEKNEHLAFLDSKVISLEFQSPSQSLLPVNNDQNTLIQLKNPEAMNLYASNENGKNKKGAYNGNWSVGVDFSPVYSYRHIENGYNSDYYNNVESPLTSYSGGINIQYKTKDRLSVRVGVYYTSIGQSLGYLSIYSNQAYNLAPDEYKDRFYQYYELDNSLGAIAINTPYVFVDERGTRVNDLSNKKSYFDVSDPIFQDINAQIQQEFQYIEVPIMVRFKFIDRKIDFNLSGGVSTNFLIGNYVYLVKGGVREVAGFTKDVNDISYSASLGLGIEYPIFNHIKLSLEPSMKYFISKVTTNPNVASHPYSFGLFTGIRYTF